MPLYEYHCQECDERFEVIQRFSDKPLTLCRLCGGSLKKLISAPAVQFKGSGWYVTDYAGKGGGKDKGGESGSSSSADSGSKNAGSKGSEGGGSQGSGSGSGAKSSATGGSSSKSSS